MLTAAIHDMLKSEGVPVVSVRTENGGGYAATLGPSATDAHRSRAEQVCQAPLAHLSARAKLAGVMVPRRVLAALVIKVARGASAPAWVDQVISEAAGLIEAQA